MSRRREPPRKTRRRAVPSAARPGNSDDSHTTPSVARPSRPRDQITVAIERARNGRNVISQRDDGNALVGNRREDAGQLVVEQLHHRGRGLSGHRQNDVIRFEGLVGIQPDTPAFTRAGDVAHRGAGPQGRTESCRQCAGERAHTSVESQQHGRAFTGLAPREHRADQAAVVALHLRHHRELRAHRQLAAVAGRDPRHRCIHQHLRGFVTDAAGGKRVHRLLGVRRAGRERLHQQPQLAAPRQRRRGDERWWRVGHLAQPAATQNETAVGFFRAATSAAMQRLGLSEPASS